MTFHSQIGRQRSGNGNKVIAIMKSQARAQTEVFAAVCVWLCAFIHSCTQAHRGHIWVKLISSQRSLQWVPAGSVSFREAYAIRHTVKSDISLKLAAVQPANACVQMAPVTGLNRKQYHRFNSALINGLVQISWCPLQQIHWGLTGFMDPQESLPDGASGLCSVCNNSYRFDSHMLEMP